MFKKDKIREIKIGPQIKVSIVKKPLVIVQKGPSISNLYLCCVNGKGK